jgi:large subunit ribosomal protein LP2
MRYVAAALLVALGGGEVSEANIKKLLDGVGIDCDSEKAAIIVKELAGKNLEELIAEGNGKLASVPSGGAAPAAAAGGAAAPAAAAAVEEVKEEEPAEESDDDMGFGLFD